MAYEQKHPYLSAIWYIIRFKLHTTRQDLCGLLGGHRFSSVDTDVHYDPENGKFTITETCFKCGKKFSFTTTEKAFGLPERR